MDTEIQAEQNNEYSNVLVRDRSDGKMFHFPSVSCIYIYTYIMYICICIIVYIIYIYAHNIFREHEFY